MKQYKYNLDKSSKKFVCPKCNKKTFVKYVDTETGNYIAEEFGRCDRESNCSYHSRPTGGHENTFEVVNIPTREPSFHNYDLISQSGRNYNRNNFVQFLKTIFSDIEVEEVVRKYLIGTSKYWNGATVFWQVDNFKNARHGKILQYVLETGKRYKDNNGRPLIHSVRSLLQLKDFNLCQCLFGLQLINDSLQKTVAVVESEKTAVIMSIFKPEYTWLATGGKGFFKYDMLLPIKRFKIVAFPDKGEYNDWFNRAKGFNESSFKIEVNDWLENSDYELGTDLADVYIIEKKKLTPIVKEAVVYSNTERTIYELEQHTPEIWELIKTFDLIDYNGNEVRKITT